MTRVKPRLVLVEWVDIVSHSGWHEKSEVLAFRPLRCQDVGWLVQQTPEFVTLVRSRQSDGGWGDAAVIPAACVLRVTPLIREPKKPPSNPTASTEPAHG